MAAEVCSDTKGSALFRRERERERERERGFRIRHAHTSWCHHGRTSWGVLGLLSSRSLARVPARASDAAARRRGMTTKRLAGEFSGVATGRVDSAIAVARMVYSVTHGWTADDEINE
ncbi:hypothetical protein Mp_1g00280 [Marchantia polymorpha subsp. ruderalis]|uniref:Uncharacterized protein n=1 Tax=Marchantia polymorpha subsp. ruderalis TaxID=1480154 RepID=A0AAF6AJW7_MARPO|nr:hypothetical protein Mp_1g00280 [Marchantia polymorpha subsp. ruderalis]